MNAQTLPAGDRVYRATWQDGSIDFFAGLGLTMIGVGWLLGQVVLSAILPALIVPFWSSFRTRFIEPRLGYVRFDETRRNRMRRGHAVLLAVSCFSLLMGVAMYFVFESSRSETPWLTRLIPGLPAVLVGIGGVLSAFMFGMPRLGVYGIVCVLLGLVVVQLQTNPGWALFLGGGVALVSGAVLLIRFFGGFHLWQAR